MAPHLAANSSKAYWAEMRSLKVSWLPGLPLPKIDGYQMARRPIRPKAKIDRRMAQGLLGFNWGRLKSDFLNRRTAKARRGEKASVQGIDVKEKRAGSISYCTTDPSVNRITMVAMPQVRKALMRDLRSQDRRRVSRVKIVAAKGAL